jgi:hypothetical protein
MSRGPGVPPWLVPGWPAAPGGSAIPGSGAGGEVRLWFPATAWLLASASGQWLFAGCAARWYSAISGPV